MSYLEQLFSLKDRFAVVTGATRGLGTAMAEALLECGATVVLVGSNQERLQETTAKFANHGLPATCFCCDLSDNSQIAGLVDYITGQHQALHVLVNNAGVGFAHKLFEYPDEDWHKTFQINVDAPFRLSKQLAPLMKEQGGSIINVTSIAAERGFPKNPAYMASKGALKLLTKSLAQDLGKYKIRVNSLGPGYFLTDMTRASWDNPRLREERVGRTILDRWGEPKDLAGAIIFLASEASSYMTGQDLYIDGGWLAKGL